MVDRVSARIDERSAADEAAQAEGGRARGEGEEAPAPEQEPAPTTEKKGPTTSIRSVMSPFLVGQRQRLVILALSAIVGGFAEAGALVVIARVAFELASKNSSDHIVVAGHNISLGALIGVAVGVGRDPHGARGLAGPPERADDDDGVEQHPQVGGEAVPGCDVGVAVVRA